MGRGKLAAIACGIAFTAAAHDPISTNLTWTKEISRVVYQRCASCHRPGGRAFSLLTYEEARPWAKGIRDEVLSRRMPPWDAVKGIGEFREDASLSLPEMDMVVNWVEGGAPEGDAAYLPPPPSSDPPLPTGATNTGLEVRSGLTLAGARVLRAIRPDGAAEVAALLPDGRVLRLLWVREFRAEWNRTYWLREPVRLPRGTRILVTGAAVRLY